MVNISHIEAENYINNLIDLSISDISKMRYISNVVKSGSSANFEKNVLKIYNKFNLLDELNSYNERKNEGLSTLQKSWLNFGVWVLCRNRGNIKLTPFPYIINYTTEKNEKVFDENFRKEMSLKGIDMSRYEIDEEAIEWNVICSKKEFM